jgi:hypothetical protein
MGSLHHRLVSIAALTTYLVVNVGAGALHHHHGTAVGADEMPAAPCTGLLFQASDQADDGDEEETCLLCSVLHLAQTSPCKVHATVFLALSGASLSTAACIRPHLFQTPTRARSPPVA